MHARRQRPRRDPRALPRQLSGNVIHTEGEIEMGRLIVSAQMTVDCVMDPMEEWFDATREEGDGVAQLRAADALILGRKTYEGLAEYWPKSDDAYAQLINPMPKFVASRTINEPLTWNSQL